MKNERIIESYNQLVPTMNKLLDDGIDIWEHHDKYSGYGFQAITKNKWVEVSIIVNFTTPNNFVVCCYERNGNCFDFLSNKKLGRKATTNHEEVYDIVKDFLK